MVGIYEINHLVVFCHPSFILPVFIAFLFAFTQFSISCSSILCRDGFRWLASIKSTTSLYFIFHRSSCVIISILSRMPRYYHGSLLCSAVPLSNSNYATFPPHLQRASSLHRFPFTTTTIQTNMFLYKPFYLIRHHLNLIIYHFGFIHHHADNTQHISEYLFFL